LRFIVTSTNPAIAFPPTLVIGSCRRATKRFVSSPNFIELVAVRGVGCFLSLVVAIQAVQQSLRVQQIPGRSEQSIESLDSLYQHTDTHTQSQQRAHTQYPPRTDGGAQVCARGHLGLHSHDVEVDQVVEVEMENTAFCRRRGRTHTRSTQGCCRVPSPLLIISPDTPTPPHPKHTLPLFNIVAVSDEAV